MNGKILGFLTAALMAAPLAANAQFTYDFTGVITSSNQDSIAIGSQISGTFTFDYADRRSDSEQWNYWVGQLERRLVWLFLGVCHYRLKWMESLIT